nr:secretory carrier-associated membrane protein 1-like isoform X3 [Anser cygnoides]
MKPTEEPPAYAQIAKEHALAQAELLKRQEELERKADELDRREREMQSLNQQRVHTVTLFLNVFGCLAWFYIDATRGVDFGLSILWFLLFTPCSFVCWYRPLYGAFRSDSSFRFFVFFFVYICQFAVHVLQAAGFQRWGNCGWISSLTGLNKSIPVGIMMIIIAALFTASAVISLVMFKKGHSLPLLQRGVPPTGCSPSQTDPAWTSHRQQLFKNYSNMGLYHGVHPSGGNCSNMGPSWMTTPTRSPAPVCAPPQPTGLHSLLCLLQLTCCPGYSCVGKCGT